jgi:HEAT repeat protein
MSKDDLHRMTHGLLRSDTSLAAIRALRGNCESAAVEGLVEVVCRNRTAAEVVAAIEALHASTSPLVCDALYAAFDSLHSSVRLAAVQSLHRLGSSPRNRSVGRLLCEDESWPVRRAALHLLAKQPDPECWRVLDAATDPHWRVRHALIGVLLERGKSVTEQREIDDRLSRLGTHALVRGVRSYLQYRWRDQVADACGARVDPSCPFWDWDAAVLLRNLERMTDQERRAAVDEMPFLLKHAAERIRTWAGKCLRDWSTVHHLACVAGMLDEPRQDGFGNAVKLLDELDEDRREELVLFLFQQSEPTAGQLAWALAQIGRVLPEVDPQPILADLRQRMPSLPCQVRCALARLCADWKELAASAWLAELLADSDLSVRCEALRSVNRRKGPHLQETLVNRLLESDDEELRAEAVTAAVRQGGHGGQLEAVTSDPNVRVRLRLAQELVKRDDAWSVEVMARLQTDQHPHVRAAALTLGRAMELMSEPTRETSWHVLAKAAQLARIPLWKVEPTPPWRPTQSVRVAAEALDIKPAETKQPRSLGPENLAVAPLGISGHYGLPVNGFSRACEAGVNLMFWEPNYSRMTEFYARTVPSVRRSIHLVAGTFEADGRRIRRDAEAVLRSLKLERVGIFLLFWVQSWQRVTPDVRAALEQLKSEGKIAAFGLSTHSRALALEAMDAGWDPVMVRHSAAHRGAEKEVFPRAIQRGTSLITFSNTCYGRLLEPRIGLPPPRAADCYRYTLMQPGVRACLSAPASLAQLEENLEALRDPVLPSERLSHLLSIGEKLYEEETVFRNFVRDVK